MVTNRIPVSPDVLTWARKNAGYDPALAARRLTVSPQTLDRWESGELAPTVVQLRRAAALYNQPLAALLLPSAPPAAPELVADFRRLDRQADATSGYSPALRAEVETSQRTAAGHA